MFKRNRFAGGCIPVVMLTVYLHDHPDALRFELAGALRGEGVKEFEQSWKTAASTLRGRGVVVDLSGVNGIDGAGERLMRAMVDAGARLVTANRKTEAMAAGFSRRVRWFLDACRCEGRLGCID
ncbi:MAG: hypothetical protein HZB13_12690 [Acidobacteria bacterium]|nr:hypothetical protein [Acidobacteriota bacterium]